MLTAARRTRWGLVLLAALGLAVSVGSVLLSVAPLRNPDWQSATGDSTPVVVAQTLVSTVLPLLLYLAAGLVVLSRQPGNRVGPLLVATGFAQPVYLTVFLPSDLVVTAGVVLYDIAAALVLHLLLTWPTGRLSSRVDHLLVVAVYVFAVAARVATTGFFDEDLGGNLLLVSDAPRPDRVSTAAVSLMLLPLALVCLARVLRRWRGVARGRRRLMSPVVVGLPVLVVLYGVVFPLANLGNDSSISLLGSGVLWLLGYGALPATFLYAAGQLRRARGAVRAAAVDIGTLPTVPVLEAALRERLKDPEVQVLRWSSAAATFVDGDGRLVDEPGGGRSLTVLEEDGAAVAAVVHDPVLEQDPALVAAILGSVRLAVDGTRLQDALHARGGDPGRLPEGEVTRLFADVEGSTALLEAAPDRYADLLAELRSSATEVVRRHGGEVVDARGDEVFAAFAGPDDGVAAALDLRARTGTVAWPGGARVRLRIGLHRGTPQRTADGYVGMDVHVAARVMSVGGGDQVVASEAAVVASDLARSCAHDLGASRLAGIRDPVRLFRLADQDRRPEG